MVSGLAMPLKCQRRELGAWKLGMGRDLLRRMVELMMNSFVTEIRLGSNIVDRITSRFGLGHMKIGVSVAHAVLMWCCRKAFEVVHAMLCNV